MYILISRGGIHMKSSKRLLIGALVSAALCQSGASALSTAGRLGVGAGVVGGVTLVTLGCYLKSGKNAKKEIITGPCVIPDISQEVTKRLEVAKYTKEKIITLIGKKKYDVLHSACERFLCTVYYEGDNFIADSEKFIPSITSLELVCGDSRSVLKGGEISSLFNSAKEINGFGRQSLYDIVDTCLRVIGSGISSKQRIIVTGNSNDSWGNGFRFMPLGDEKYYSFFVNSDLNEIKLCYHNGYGNKTQDCAIVLKL